MGREPTADIVTEVPVSASYSLSINRATGIVSGLWSAFGPAATFIAGAGFAALAAAGLLLYRPRPQADKHRVNA